MTTLICLYIVGFFLIDDKSAWSKIAIKVADVLVIGVVLGFITNAAQFIGIFKQDLQDILYGKEFIRQRKDIYPLWENISKELFKNKFPTLHKELLKTINGYFPKDDVSYYNDYEIHTSIEWIDKEQVEKLAKKCAKTEYGKYLKRIIKEDNVNYKKIYESDLFN